MGKQKAEEVHGTYDKKESIVLKRHRKSVFLKQTGYTGLGKSRFTMVCMEN